MQYPENKKLAALPKKYDIFVEELESDPEVEELILISFSAKGKSWNLFIKDDHGDFDEDNQLLCIYLSLRALEDFKDSEDLSSWCRFYGVRPTNDVVANYYREMPKIYQEIKATIKKIDPCISAFDYELRTGAFNELIEA